MSDEPPVLPFASREEWGAWLEENHERPEGVWLAFARKASGIPTVSYAEAVEEALRFGWIDGQHAKSDPESDFHHQRFVPRRPRSLWSKINRQRVESLVAAGRMEAPGLAEVKRAKADGRWDAAYDAPSTAEAPADLSRALDALPGARAFFEGLSSANRYAILHRVMTAKKPETRARRIEKFARMCADGETLH